MVCAFATSHRRLEAPVVRHAAWMALLAKLEPRTSSVVLIAGSPGSGRTHILRRIGEAARMLEYTTVGCDDGLGIEPTTTLVDIHRILFALLDSETEDAPANRAGVPPGIVRRALGALRESVDYEQAIFGLLARAAPAVMAVDGCSPSPTLADWFITRLIPHFRSSKAPLVLLVADRVEALTWLRDTADEVIELGPLDLDEVGTHLRAIGRGMQQPLNDDEIRAYCEAVAGDLSLLTPLAEVLRVLAAER